MKNKITLLLLLFHSVLFFGQEESHPDLLETDNWGKEIFEFPIKFAPEIDYKGIEEARFPKGWINRDTSTFWSYAFVWKIEEEVAITAAVLEKDLGIYFDGLNEIKEKRKGGVYIQNTVALFLKNDDNSFTGKIRLYDRFATKKLFTLNVMVETQYCKQSKKTIILFKFSPKEFGHQVWEELNGVKAKGDICDL